MIYGWYSLFADGEGELNDPAQKYRGIGGAAPDQAIDGYLPWNKFQPRVVGKENID